MTDDVVAVAGIATGGDGVGRLADGRAVFVPRTAPGERVRLRPETVRMHKNFARGEVAEILTPASVRVEPACPHYGPDRCSGCQLQHLGYAAQLAAKREIVVDTLRRIGKLDAPDVTVVGAPEQWRYRTSISLTVAGHSRTAIGFPRYDRSGSVFPLVDCHIADARLMALWRQLQPHLELLPERLVRLDLRLDREGVRHLIAESAGEPWRTAAQLREILSEGAGVVCWWRPSDGAARVVAGPTPGFTPTGFEADYPQMDAAVRDWVLAGLGDVQNTLVWDLYGGFGDTTAELARRGATVVSVDANEQAVAWARSRPDIVSHGERVRLIAGRVEDVVAGLPEPQAVIVSPPRSGLHWDVALRLTGEPVPRLVYVSGDPATLARDLHRVSVNYTIRSVRAFDAHPQTAQVRTVAHVERAAA
jgi:23S rRNA (uracil1939-C5)-methyltransferase